MNFSAQLYSCRKEIEENYPQLFKDIKRIGFDYVQVDGTRGHSVEEIAACIKENDLKVSSLHIKDNRFEDDLEGIIYECELFETKVVYCKYIDDDLQNEAGYIHTKKVLTNAVNVLAKHEITVGLHNPEYDFNNLVEGQKVMDYICDGSGVFVEPDTYWLTEAKENIMDYIQRYAGTFPEIHLKDYANESIGIEDGYEIYFTECGKGRVNFKEIIEHCEKNDVKFLTVEQDKSSIGIINSFEQSLNYLKSLKQ